MYSWCKSFDKPWVSSLQSLVHVVRSHLHIYTSCVMYSYGYALLRKHSYNIRSILVKSTIVAWEKWTLMNSSQPCARTFISISSAKCVMWCVVTTCKWVQCNRPVIDFLGSLLCYCKWCNSCNILSMCSNCILTCVATFSKEIMVCDFRESWTFHYFFYLDSQTQLLQIV